MDEFYETKLFEKRWWFTLLLKEECYDTIDWIRRSEIHEKVSAWLVKPHQWIRGASVWYCGASCVERLVGSKTQNACESSRLLLRGRRSVFLARWMYVRVHGGVFSNVLRTWPLTCLSVRTWTPWYSNSTVSRKLGKHVHEWSISRSLLWFHGGHRKIRTTHATPSNSHKVAAGCRKHSISVWRTIFSFGSVCFDTFHIIGGIRFSVVLHRFTVNWHCTIIISTSGVRVRVDPT